MQHKNQWRNCAHNNFGIELSKNRKTKQKIKYPLKSHNYKKCWKLQEMNGNALHKATVKKRQVSVSVFSQLPTSLDHRSHLNILQVIQKTLHLIYSRTKPMVLVEMDYCLSTSIMSTNLFDGDYINWLRNPLFYGMYSFVSVSSPGSPASRGTMP